MSVAKVVEVISEGKTVDEAIKAAVAEVGKTVQNIRQVNVQHIEGLVEKGEITKFRVNAKVTFVIDRSLD